MAAWIISLGFAISRKTRHNGIALIQIENLRNDGFIKD